MNPKIDNFSTNNDTLKKVISLQEKLLTLEQPAAQNMDYDGGHFG